MSILQFPRQRRASVPQPAECEVQYRTVHGYRRAFVYTGSGPALLLIHGIGDSSDTWRELIPKLARDHTVIAPDLLGHSAIAEPDRHLQPSAFGEVRERLEALNRNSRSLVARTAV